VECRGADAGSDTTGRCDQGNACNPVGNICGAHVLPDGGSVNAPQDCCNGHVSSGGQVTPGSDVCKLDSSGIPRCFGGASTQCPTGYTGQEGCCIAAGDECQFKDQCCGGAPCVPGPSGKLVCTVASCTPVGTACTSSTECCAGTSCRPTETGGSVCQVTPQGNDAGTPDAGSSPDAGACHANGTACTVGVDCCSQRCSGADGGVNSGTCQAPVACQPQGSTCTSTADCCTGNACLIPPGAPTGTCQSTTCNGNGQACTSGNQCCPGLYCLDQTNVFCNGTGDCACRVLLN